MITNKDLAKVNRLKKRRNKLEIDIESIKQQIYKIEKRIFILIVKDK